MTRLKRAGTALAFLATMLPAACGRRSTDERAAASGAASGSAGDPIADAISSGAFPRTTSVLAMQGDTTLYEGYFAGTGADTLHDVRSVTKSVAALAVGV